MTEYYTILTDAGRALEAAAMAGQTTYKLAVCALGDGTEPPDPAAVALRNEVWRGSINTLTQDDENPNWLVVETHLPPDIGGFTIREFGIYTDDGVLFAIGKYPETYKPVLSDGTGVDLNIRIICEVSNAESVTLLIDPSIVMASKQYVDDALAQKVDRGGVCMGIKAFDTPGVQTYTPTPGTRYVKVIVTGGGGGSGASTYEETEHRGAGGGAGGTAIDWIDLDGISSVSVTVGAGGDGAVGADSNGQNGESSSFGAYLSATGGGGGEPTHGGGGGGKGYGGTGFEGGNGSDGTIVKGSGDGGSSFWGGGGRAGAGYGEPIQNLVGGAPGAGVGGRYVTGDKGKSGIVYIEEYA